MNVVTLDDIWSSSEAEIDFKLRKYNLVGKSLDYKRTYLAYKYGVMLNAKLLKGLIDSNFELTVLKLSIIMNSNFKFYSNTLSTGEEYSKVFFTFNETTNYEVFDGVAKIFLFALLLVYT